MICSDRKLLVECIPVLEEQVRAAELDDTIVYPSSIHRR